MDTTDPHVAQQIVGAYAALLEQHAVQDVHAASLAVLPYPKEVIKASVRTSVAALASTGALTDELRDFLEVAYISLADYIEDDLVRLVHEHQQASAALAADGRLATEKRTTPAWQCLAETSRLVGKIAKAMAEDTDALRKEFRALLS